MSNHYESVSLQDRLGEEMAPQTSALNVNTRPARDFPCVPTLLLQAILVDRGEADQQLALEKANRSMAAYLKDHRGPEGKSKFLTHAMQFLQVNFERMIPFNFNLHAISRLKDVAAALGASREFSLAWRYAEPDVVEKPKSGIRRESLEYLRERVQARRK
jgi:hypothetical protein